MTSVSLTWLRRGISQLPISLTYQFLNESRTQSFTLNTRGEVERLGT